MEDIKNLHFYDSEMRELIIRGGKAPDIFIPKPQKFNSTINGPADYFSTQHDVTDKPIKLNPLVKYNIEKGWIEYCNCIMAESSVTIKGELILHPDLVNLSINAPAGGVAPRDLAMKLKRIRHHFPDLEEYSTLIHALTNLVAKISTAVESSEQQTGDRRRLVDKVVNSNLPGKFTLNIPIFVGTDPISIFIDIYVDTSESDVRVQLHSPDLIEQQFKLSNALITEQLKRFDAGIPKLHCI